MYDEGVTELHSDDAILQSSSDYTEVTIPGHGSAGIGPSVDMDSGHALQTISFSVAAGDDIRSGGFDWSDWDQSGFSSQGLVEEDDGSLILGFQGITWDFDNGTEGWSSSSTSFGQYNTGITCGMSGNNGGSWWTRGGSVTITSPKVSLAGYQGLSLNTWIRQGNYGCGEEPDTNENFYLEYKNSNNGWSQIQYLAGSTSGGSVTNVNYNLPANAYHADFQIRARQNAGSGTCCDYWFFDDVVVPGTTGATLTTRSFGWSNGAHEQLEEGRYPPMYIEAKIPDGAHLNWTVIDADTNNPVPGLVNRSGQWVDLSVVDWSKHKSLKLDVDFSSNPQGESPRLYGISGGGKIYDSFSTDPEINGWELNDTVWNPSSFGVTGVVNSTIISPVYDIDMPFSAYKFESDMVSNATVLVSLDRGNWTEINSSSQVIYLDEASNSIQFHYQGLANWELQNFQLQLYPSSVVSQPRMDIDNDGINEWEVVGDGIGSWGNQDVFLDGNSSTTFSVGLSPTKWHNLLIPKNAKSFEVTVDNVGSVGLGVQTIALWVGNVMISQTGGTGHVDGLRLSLNQTELDLLNYETHNSASMTSVGGSDFVLAKVESITDAGSYRIAGLTIGYDAKDVVVATAIDEMVLAMNRARLDVNKASSLPLIFNAESSCILEVEIISFTTSGDVTIGALTWNNYSQVLTPSQNWREINTRAQIHTSSPHRLILNMYTEDKVAMWFIPMQSGNIIGTGDHDSLIMHDGGLIHNHSQDIHDIMLSFRTSQHLDDQSYLRLESRIQLSNGVVSMPVIDTWINSAIDNDMLIESMSVYSDRGMVPSSLNYLMAEDNLAFEIDVGFEDGDSDDKPFPGEFLLEFTRNGEVIANTTGYNGSSWVVETATPFTSGNVTYGATLTPLAGGELGDPYMVNRTFEIDPLAPVVTGANIRYFDHRQSSATQELIINITDQPVLPEDVTLMLWNEWSNDYDGDGWPSEGEFIARTLDTPVDLDATYGSYTTLIDDTSGYPGEKVAGYVVGADPSGHVIIGGGSNMTDDHLFMYQIMTDGTPVIDSDGFEWTDGRRAWLHPGQTYGLNISFTETNGISDLSEIEIVLADNIESDQLILRWDAISRNCSSQTDHIAIVSCIVLDQNGFTPDPFDQDLVLYLEITPQWTLPDLGDIRREPLVRIYDRAGNQDVESFPQNRWRFSAEMMIPEELSLWAENGAVTDDGARVSPGSSMELSGEVVFFRSMEKPQFECDIEVRLNGVKTSAVAQDGLFTAALNAPLNSGQHAMTWNVDCMPEQGIDLTSPTQAVKWILVDAIGPQVVEFSSPRESSILATESHFVRVIISENYGIDADSVELIWWVTAKGQNSAIVSGSTDLQLDGVENAGLRLEFIGSVDLSDISPEFLHEQTVLKMRFEGRDIAGNQFVTTGNSENSPAGVWDLEHYVPDYSIERSGIELSKSNLEVDEPTIVQIHIRNDGKLGGDAEVLVEVVDLNGERNQLTKTTIFVESQSVSTLVVDWKPSVPGIQRIEVTLYEETEKSEFIDVKPTQERAFLEDTIGSANSWILGTTIVMLCAGILFLLSWMRAATAKHGQSDIEWDLEDEEFDEEFED